MHTERAVKYQNAVKLVLVSLSLSFALPTVKAADGTKRNIINHSNSLTLIWREFSMEFDVRERILEHIRNHVRMK